MLDNPRPAATEGDAGGMKTILLLGSPILRSFSPAMQNAAFRAAGLRWRYLSAEGAEAAPAINAIRSEVAVIGANVTIPLKETVIPYLDELDALATRVSAVNTIAKRGSKLIGYNTDVIGFRRALDECGYDVAGKPVALLGAGGAARAAADVLRSAVSTLVVIARRVEQAQQLINDLEIERGHAIAFEAAGASLASSAVIVNATPADLVDRDRLAVGQRLFDLRSRRSTEGRSMLLHQGAAAFEIWAGVPAPLEAMRAALEEAAAVVA